MTLKYVLYINIFILRDTVGGDLDMFLNFVVRELDGCGGEQMSPFSYGIKKEKWEDGDDSRVREFMREPCAI